MYLTKQQKRVGIIALSALVLILIGDVLVSLYRINLVFMWIGASILLVAGLTGFGITMYVLRQISKENKC